MFSITIIIVALLLLLGYLMVGLLRKCVSKFSLVLLLRLGYRVTVSRHCNCSFIGNKQTFTKKKNTELIVQTLTVSLI